MMDSDFNRRAQECTNHRMVMVAFESKVVTTKQPDGFYKAQEVDTYTYHCKGECQQTYTFTPKTK